MSDYHYVYIHDVMDRTEPVPPYRTRPCYIRRKLVWVSPSEGRPAMGSRSTYRCSGCGYAAEVSGEPDGGFMACTRTVYCMDCKSLQDVVTATRKDDIPEDPFKPVRNPRCASCGSRKIKGWTAGDPCPKCQGRMLRDKQDHILWD